LRVYLPATFPLLAQWLASGEATGGAGFAVTPALREWYYEGDLDELEHAAQITASARSLELLADDVSAPRRRVVIAADVEDAAVSNAADRGRAAVNVTGTVPVRRWGSALVDDPDAEPVVSAAVTALSAAAGGDADAQFTLDEAAAYELGWHGVQELPHILDESA
jgi:hypothetical protein